MGARLGRGLDSLLGILDRDEEVADILENNEVSVKPLKKENVEKDKNLTKNSGVQDIEMSLIDNNLNQPRKKQLNVFYYLD